MAKRTNIAARIFFVRIFRYRDYRQTDLNTSSCRKSNSKKKLPLKYCRRNENFWSKPQKPILRCVCEDASRREQNNNNKLFKVPLE